MSSRRWAGVLIVCLSACGDNGASTDATSEAPTSTVTAVTLDASDASDASAATSESDSETGSVPTECGPAPLDMVCVPEGAFTMGNAAVPGLGVPEHTVTLSAFFIDRDEVTVAAYRACVDDGSCAEPNATSTYWMSDADALPVGDIDWFMASDYCTYAGKRLPTEAEWEKAAVGAEQQLFPWGDTPASCEYAVIVQDGVSGCGEERPWEVGSRPAGASPYGAFDMVGNMTEWVADWYQSGYYDESPDTDPPGPDDGFQRVVRGGSYRWDEPLSWYVAYRSWSVPDFSLPDSGARCVADVQP